jgi:hypothetical protein
MLLLRKMGHLSPECPDRNKIKKDKWHIKKATQYYQDANKPNDHQDEQQEEGDNESFGSTTSKASSQIGWSGLIVEQSLYNDDRDAKDRLKNCIILDNESTLSLFSNPDLVQDIRTSSKTLSLATNAGVKQSNREAIVLDFGKVYYDEDAIANIFGFSDLKKKHRITYDSNKDDAFIVHMDKEIIKCECSPLYQYSVSEGYQRGLKEDQKEKGASNLISTVAENRKGYTLCQFERAKEARRLCTILSVHRLLTTSSPCFG